MNIEELDWLPFLLQVSDPLFPTGAYAHPLGLEEIVRLGVIEDEAGLLYFLREHVMPALTHLELPYLRFSFEAAQGADIDRLCEIDREISAWKICRELRNASVQLGMRRLQMLLKIFSGDTMEAFEKRRSAEDADGNQIVVYAMQMAAKEVPLQATLFTYLYQTIAGYCSAALKLIRIGQEGCQRVMKQCLDLARACVSDSLAVRRAEAGWFSPILEIASMRHEFADERLFIS